MDASFAKKRILVVDDHPVVRQAIVALLDKENDLVCCGEVAKLSDIVPAINLKKPDLVLLDLFLDADSSLPLIEPLREQFPQTFLLILSQYEETIYVEQALEAGAAGYLLKEESPREILSAIRAVFQEEIYLSHKLAGRLLHQFLGIKTVASHPKGIQYLTHRELQVLYLLKTGMTTKQIADQLELSQKTVEVYCDHIKHKFNPSNTGKPTDFAVKEPPL